MTVSEQKMEMMVITRDHCFLAQGYPVWKPNSFFLLQTRAPASRSSFRRRSSCPGKLATSNPLNHIPLLSFWTVFLSFQVSSFSRQTKVYFPWLSGTISTLLDTIGN